MRERTFSRLLSPAPLFSAGGVRGGLPAGLSLPSPGVASPASPAPPEPPQPCPSLLCLLSQIHVDKHDIVDALDIRYRDLLTVDPSVPLPFPAAVLIRAKALVVNLEVRRHPSWLAGS